MRRRRLPKLTLESFDHVTNLLDPEQVLLSLEEALPHHGKYVCDGLE